ncbi:hypothetical protein NDU88_005477 [Pleurodeles waltl]|uniref:Uncharacterized protein n=1 Tax=Pleurodeles waltl TaxID=8319 RepID=A0AAV7RMB8_PLEWA|nr:hypothetical protein NDU88_005477 [Pleurodeles waltl]
MPAWWIGPREEPEEAEGRRPNGGPSPRLSKDLKCLTAVTGDAWADKSGARGADLRTTVTTQASSKAGACVKPGRIDCCRGSRPFPGKERQNWVLPDPLGQVL